MNKSFNFKKNAKLIAIATMAFIMIFILLFSICELNGLKNVYAVDGWPNQVAGNENDYIPGWSEISNGINSGSLPVRIGENYRYKSKLISGWTSGESIDLSNFGVASGACSGESYGNLNRTSNSIEYTNETTTPFNYWKYMYGIFEVPNDIKGKDAIITVSADTYAYNSEGISKRYLSVVSGYDLWEYQAGGELTATDMRMNQTTGYSNTDCKEDAAKTEFESNDTQRQTVSIKVASTDKYIRVSFVQLHSSNEAVSNYGQKIENLRIHYKLDIELPAITDADFKYPGKSHEENKDTYAPNIEAAGITNLSLYSFPSNYKNLDSKWIEQKSYYATLTQMNSNSENISTSSFGAAALNGYNNSVTTDPNNNGGIYRANDSMSFRAEYSNRCDQFWVYMFAYIKLPEGHKGGKVTVNADTASFSDKENNRHFLSLSAGKQIFQQKTSNINLTDIDLNRKIGATTAVNGTKDSTSKAQGKFNMKNQSVSLVVSPKDKIVRISFIQFTEGYSSERGQKIANVNVNFDPYVETNQEPVIYSEQFDINNNIICNVKDNEGDAFNVYLDGNGVNHQLMQSKGNGGYAFPIVNNGTYAITAIDTKGAEITKQIEVKTIKPKIGEPDIKYNNNDNTISVNIEILEFNAGGLSKVKIFNTETPNIEIVYNQSNSIYSFVANENGTYKIEVIDNLGNNSTKEFTLNQIDKTAPTINEITNLTDLAIGSKEIAFVVKDPATIKSVTINGDVELVNNGGDNVSQGYKFIAKNAQTYTVTMIDKWDNTATYDIVVKNIIKLGQNVEKVSLAGNVLEIKVINNVWSQDILTPLFNEGSTSNIQVNYNYGNEASFTITFNLDIDCSRTIEANYNPYKVNINVTVKQDNAIGENEMPNKYPLGSKQQVNVGSIDGYIFVGIYNEKDLLIASPEDIENNKGIFEFVITRANANYIKKYVKQNNENILITYQNLAGRILNKIYVNSFDPNANKELAPEIPYMTFNKWILKEGNIAVPEYSSNQTFNVTIDGVPVENAYFNKRIDLVDSQFGWIINGEKVTSNSQYHVYVTNDMVIEKATEKAVTPVKDIEISKTGDTIVVTGILEEGAQYNEIGLVVADIDLNNKNFIINNANMIMRFPIINITNSGQFMFAIKANIVQGMKFRMYTINAEGVVDYSSTLNVSDAIIKEVA